MSERFHEDGTITCTLCGERKGPDEYYKGKPNRCKKCSSKVAMEYYNSHKPSPNSSLANIIVANKRRKMSVDEIKLQNMLDSVKLIKRETPEMSYMKPKASLVERDGIWQWI